MGQGMMNAPMPAQGGMMGQPTQGGGPLPSQEVNNLPPYNGVVDFDGEKIEVVDGSFKFEGIIFHVSDDGSMVMNSERDLLGRIENGVFIEVDDEQISNLRNAGMLE